MIRWAGSNKNKERETERELIREEGRAVNYTGTQSFITLLFNSLAEKPWALFN